MKTAGKPKYWIGISALIQLCAADPGLESIRGEPSLLVSLTRDMAGTPRIHETR